MRVCRIAPAFLDKCENQEEILKSLIAQHFIKLSYLKCILVLTAIQHLLANPNVNDPTNRHD